MPANVAAPSYGTPPRVMPRALCVSFEESRDYDGVVNSYQDGRRTAVAISGNSRRRFRMTSRDQTNAMRNFYLATGNRPFYFYFWKEGAHDPSGVSTAGRYGCVFEGDYSETTEMIGNQSVTIAEVA